MDGLNCPTAGLYKLCFTAGEDPGTAHETGIAVNIKEVQVETTIDGGFVDTLLHEVNTNFTIVVTVVDPATNASCCRGTKVHLGLTKGTADHGAYLYNGLGSNNDTDKTVTVGANGIAVFSGYTIQRTAGDGYYFTASIAGHSVNIPSTGSFHVVPNHLAVTTTFDAAYTVGAALTATLPASVTVEARDAAGTVLEGLVTADAWTCEVMLQSGLNGTDSGVDSDWGGVPDTTDLVPATYQAGDGAGLPKFNAGAVTFSALLIKKQAGRHFRLSFIITQQASVTGTTTTFSVSPAKMKAASGAGDYAAGTFPTVVRLDGEASDTPDADGLPTTLTVSLLDSAGAVLTSASCLTNCVAARLVKCDDSTPTGGTTNGGTIAGGLPTGLCDDVHATLSNANETDQMLGMTQAFCATTGGACAKATDFAQTLSSSSAAATGTTSDVVAGVATFTGLQPRYVFGAGYKVRFVLDFTEYDAEGNLTVVGGPTIKTVHAPASGQLFLPDAGAHVVATYKSFYIRPYALEVAQSPGGDGVDLDALEGLYGDNTTGTPDGVAQGIPFRVQPAVLIKGYDNATQEEYYFTRSWGTHGHAPVTAVIKSDSCSGAQAGFTCVDQEIALEGNLTGPSVACTSIAAEASGSAALGTCTAGNMTTPPQLVYNALLGNKVGMLWQDLRVNAKDATTGYEGLQLTIVTGLLTNTVAQLDTGKMTTADSGIFDLFIAPDPPTNLRVTGYGELGFRIEFDPATVYRLKPLSGFIIELDFCAKSGAVNGSCPVETTPGFAAALGVPTRELGSDFYRAGGRTEDVVLTYDPETAATATAITIDMVPTEHLGAGDTITIVLDSPGLYVAADAACVPTGTHATLVTASVNSSSAIILTVAADQTIYRGSAFQITLPSTCGFVYPDLTPGNGSGQSDAALLDLQVSRYGSTSPTPKKFVLAYVRGTALRGDNCKADGCTVARTRLLPLIQDTSSMDLAWSGKLQYGGIGAACRSTVASPRASGTFPSSRYCAAAGTGSNDPDPNDGNPFGNSGDNGAPIGSNYGRKGTVKPVTNGRVFSDSEARCREGTNTVSPCPFAVGSDWSTSAMLAWTHDGTTATQVVVTVKRDRYTPAGATFTVPLSGSNGGDAGTDGANASLTIVVAQTSNGTSLATWAAAWAEASATLTLTLGTSVAPETEVAITIGGLTLAPTSFPPSVIVPVDHGLSRTTLVVKNGAMMATMAPAAGDPTGGYTASASPLAVAAGDIVNVRVYAYNGRYRSPAATTLVQARAITKPAAPAYFPSQTQDSMVAALLFDTPEANEATNITLTFTPTFDFLNGTFVSVVLPNFGGHDLASACANCTTQVLEADGVTPHRVFVSAGWVKNTSTLVFKVGPDYNALTDVEYSVMVSRGMGITYPADSVVQLLPDGTPGTTAYITRYRLNWVSPFPTVSAPREGFVIQVTTDRDWVSDIQTIKLPDKLNRGVADLRALSTLPAAVATLNETTVTLGAATSTPLKAYDALVGSHLKIDSEYLLITAVTGDALTVVRGAANSAPQVHAAAAVVYLAYLGATDPTKGFLSGLDRQIGTAGPNPNPAADGCLLGSVNFPRGCNVRSPPVAYPGGLRTHQTAYIVPGAARTVSLTNCGTAGDVCTSPACKCSPPTSVAGTDLGSVLEAGVIGLRNTGDPLQWSVRPTTTLALAINSTTVKNLILANAGPVTASYLRIGDELMYVEGPKSKGVGRVFLYTAQGRPASAATPCACDNAGNTSAGGSECGCSPSNTVAFVSGCLAGGTLMAVGGGGSGFQAYFTVDAASGTIDDIVVTNPGYGYVQNPTISIASVGTNCSFSNIAWRPLISNNVVRVQRGSYGTTAATHAAGLHVGIVTWPLRGGFQSPGTQYYFRIAAFNSAGMSNWLYYLHAITEMNPHTVATLGSTRVEVLMEGGGYSGAHSQIYIGKMKADLTGVDLTRSKLCRSVVVDDIAGTRLTCVTPPWVGRQHDLIVRFKSGSIEKFSVANNFVNFPAPIISSISPQKFEAGSSPLVTVLGQNFGTSAAEVRGYLRTATVEVPCKPLTLIADTTLTCQLNPVPGVELSGVLVVTVGRNYFSGGAQNTTTGTFSQILITESPAPVEITLAGDIAELLASPARLDSFKVSVARDIANALGLSLARIRVDEVKGGSIIVVFVILADPNSVTSLTPAQAAAEIVKQAADPTSLLLSGTTTSAVVGVTVSAAILAEAAATTGTLISTSTKPTYFTESEPKTYTLPDMELCYRKCRYMCETGNEIPAVNGVPVRAQQRSSVCSVQCLNHCGFGRPKMAHSAV